MKSFGMPGFSKDMSTCQLSLYHFCDNLENNDYNLCPKKLRPRFKDICIVNLNQKIDLLTSCKKELENNCKKSENETFLQTYTCLASPENWNNYSKGCLKALASPHKNESQNNNI